MYLFQDGEWRVVSGFSTHLRKNRLIYYCCYFSLAILEALEFFGGWKLRKSILIGNRNLLWRGLWCCDWEDGGREECGSWKGMKKNPRKFSPFSSMLGARQETWNGSKERQGLAKWCSDSIFFLASFILSWFR